MRASPKLLVERMEDRLTPAQFGLPWLNPDVTVSYAPDGTAVDWAKSSLTAALAADGLTTSQWQGEVQRAFHTWATAVNLNFGVVADGGQAVGTAGRLQGDTRFGDIRLVARPLNDDVLAITTPPGATSETRAGDIVLNTNYDFGVNPAEGSGRYDLYTVMLQEIGHAIGVGNSTDPNSVMYGQYKGTRGGLTAGDVAAAQKLYGPRKADGFEGANGNGSRGTAAELPVTPGTSTRYLRGNLSAPGDTDFYTFVTPAQMPNGVTVRLRTAGLSLLAGRVQIQDATGSVVVASPINAAPGADQEVTTTALAPNTRYFVRVNAPSAAAFRVGSYDLRVVFDPAAADPAATPAPVVVKDAGANDTFATATPLTPVPGTTALALYRGYGQIETSSDQDVYRITAPADPTSNPVTLNVQVASYSPTANTGGLAAVAKVYDVTGKLLAVEDLTYNGARKSYQVRGVPAGVDYYVAVSYNGLLSDRNYELTAFFSGTEVNFGVTDSLTVAPNQDTAFRTLVVKTAQVFTLNVESKSVGSGAPSLVFLDVLDAAGKTVASVVGYPGLNYGTSVLLTPGEYTVRVRASYSGSSAAPLQMILRMDALTDPIGLAPPADPTTTPTAGVAPPPPTPPLPFDWVTYDLSYYAWLM